MVKQAHRHTEIRRHTEILFVHILTLALKNIYCSAEQVLKLIFSGV